VKYKDIFGSYKQVFLDFPCFESAHFASLSIIDSNLILDPTMIDGSMEMFCRLSKLIALQFFGCFIVPKHWSDSWLIYGFAGYLELTFLQKEFGKNEFKYQFLKASELLNELETHNQPLFTKSFVHPSELITDYMKIKSSYVVHMIGKFISLTNLKKYLNKLITTAVSNPDDSSNRLISTKNMIKTLKNTYGVDLKHFFDYWVYSTGIPILQCGYKYDMGRSIIEIDIKQETPFDGKIFNVCFHF
jgi:aminopeptidase N